MRQTTLTTGQKIEIQDLTNSKGLLPMQLGTARTILGNNNLFHIVRLEQYQQNVDQITNTLENFEHLQLNEMTDTLNIIKIKLKELKHKLQTLMPRFITKRGLIDGLGTVIKSITGNMDANDATLLNKQIEMILNNENIINKKINHQDNINKQMIERLDNITKHINNQQQTIADYLKHTQNQIKNQIKSEDSTIRYLQFLNQVNYNIDLLNDHISSISEAVILAKLNIISKQILNRDELSHIHTLFKKQNVTINIDEHIYELLGLQAYYNDTNIIFNVQIPIISSETYSLFHIIPLPTESSKTILTKPYLIINPENIQYLDKKCPCIGVYYCQETAYREKTDDSRCIGNLINNKPAHCELHEKEMKIEIFQPEPNFVLLINIPETVIFTTCGPKKQKVKGTALIHFNKCEIKINDIIYSTTENIYWDEINIYPTIFKEINTTIVNDNILLKNLDNYQFAEKESIENLEPYVHLEDLYKTTSLFTIIPLIIIVLICFWTYRKLNKNLGTHSINPSPIIPTNAPANEPARIQFVWPSLNSKGGGVTYPA